MRSSPRRPASTSSSRRRPTRCTRRASRPGSTSGSSAQNLEGEFRPGHFRGVATVCLKLFNIVRPDRAYFGQKDAQQAAVVKQLVRDLNLGLEIRVVPTVRDDDGLALSSRNAYLSPEEREAALALPRALATKDPARARELLGDLDVDYVEVASFNGQRVLAAAVRIGKTRLIDNVILEGEKNVSTPPKGKLALPELGEMKRRGQKIVMVTAYDAPGARFAEDAGVDVILVGDTAAMVVLGHEGTTVPVTMDEMLFLTRTVARAARHPIVVGDMPFGSFQVSDEKAVENAIRFVKEAGADAVKLEGAGPMLSRVKSIVEAGIPVMGHVGLTPQSATMLGGFKTQGKTAEAARQLVDDALALEEVGAFSVVLEAVPAPVAAEVTRRLSVPTIGIGAGRETDGQVLVYHDLLGLTEGHLPRFVKRYANLSREIRDALEAYAEEVRAGTFPEDEHTYEMPEEELERFRSSSSPRAHEPERPEVARDDQDLEDPVAGALVRAAGAEDVSSVDGNPGQPDEEQRERERRRREARAGGAPGGKTSRLRARSQGRGRRGRRASNASVP